MNITIFGASEFLGKYLVRQGLALDNVIYAFGRNVYTSGFRNEENLHLLQGLLFDENQVYNALKDSEAVITVINQPTDEFDKSRSLGIKNIVKQMEKAGVKRIINIGETGVMLDESGKFIMEDPDYPKANLEASKEDLQVLETLKNSDLDWTFVAIPKLLDEDVSGIYKTANDLTPMNLDDSIKAGDVGLFIFNELKKSENLKLKVELHN